MRKKQINLGKRSLQGNLFGQKLKLDFLSDSEDKYQILTFHEYAG